MELIKRCRDCIHFDSDEEQCDGNVSIIDCWADDYSRWQAKKSYSMNIYIWSDVFEN